MPPVFPGVQAETLPQLARALQLDETTFMDTVNAYNTALPARQLRPHPARRLPHRRVGAGQDPLGAVRSTHRLTSATRCAPASTFTYLGLKTDRQARVHFGGRPSANLFVAGEMMAGNVLGQGYTAGVGMSIGTAFGRIAGAEAAASVGHTHPETHRAIA